MRDASSGAGGGADIDASREERVRNAPERRRGFGEAAAFGAGRLNRGAGGAYARLHPRPIPVRRFAASAFAALASLAFLSLGTPGVAHAQRGTVSGYVRDAETGETLLGANVALVGTSTGTVTNASGYYTLSVPSGAVRLSFSYLGYAPLTREATVAPGQNVRLDVTLAPEDEDLDEVTVTGEAERREEVRRVGVAEISTETIRQLPSVLEPDVFRSLQRLPGIKAASDFSSGLYIRGGSPDQTLILLDRTTVYNPTHFFGVFSTFNPDAIKDVRVYKGGYPSEYGGRLGSVVDIYNKDGNRVRHDGTVSVGLLASRALVEGPVGPKGDGGTRRGSYMFAARRSTLEPLLAALNAAEVDGIPERFYFYDLNGKVGVDVGPNDRVAISGYAGRDYVRVPFLEDAGVELRYGNATASATWTHLFSPRLFSTFTATVSRYDSNPLFTIAATTFERPLTLTDVSLKGDAEAAVGAEHRVRAGFWTGNFNLRLTQSFNQRETFRARINAPYVQAYAQDRWTPSERVAVDGGLRMSYFHDGRYLRAEPRLNVEWKTTDRVRLQAGYGRYTQFLTLISSELFTGADLWLTAAEGVPPSYGDQFVGGVKTDLTRRLRLDVEGYYRTMRDLFEFDPYVSDPAGIAYREYFRFGDGYATGIETLLEGTVGRVQGFVGYSWGMTRRRFPNAPQPNAPPRYYAPKFDRTHDLNVVASIPLGRGWKATPAFVFGTGQAYSPAVASYQIGLDPFSSSPQTVVVSNYQGERLPPYHRLDVGVTKEGRFFGGFADYELQLQVINAYGRDNPWFYFYQSERDGSVERTRVNQIPIPLPNVALTLNF